jgi:hypothetical protein
LEDTGLHSHYTSLMLNRFMFCYFLQRKGFLDGDPHYLRNRLESVEERVGAGQFHSFYQSFLRRLFREGLDEHADARSTEIRELIGEIPYLNGGLFEEHHIEREHPDIHIPDEAFAKVFAFFDQYDWHLDDRPIAGGNEINPEVLGYVFEKYTNQKQMGAYYTKEDITEYISKNCIIPFLFDSVRDKLDDAVWQMAQDDPDRYIYSAVGHGTFVDYYSGRKLGESLPVPDYIERGIDTEAPDLLDRRERWNEAATREVALPTEIWRETVARRQRCAELQQKLRDGHVRSINDFITLTLAPIAIPATASPPSLPAKSSLATPTPKAPSTSSATCFRSRSFWSKINDSEPISVSERKIGFMVDIDATARFRPLLWFALIVMAPLFEESLFRGFLIPGMQRSFLKAPGAILLTSALWALIHSQYEPFHIGIIFVGGILLGTARVSTGSLPLCIFLHATMNIIATVELEVYKAIQ